MESETQSLLTWLRRQRQHVLGILEDLPEADLRRPVLPSGWSALTLVDHLALEVEHYWFRCIIAGESLDFFPPSAEGSGWSFEPALSVVDTFDRYRQEAERSDAIIAETPLDRPPAQRDPWWGDWDVPDLRFVMLHVIAETACHAGHLDAARELIDGRQWLVL